MKVYAIHYQNYGDVDLWGVFVSEIYAKDFCSIKNDQMDIHRRAHGHTGDYTLYFNYTEVELDKMYNGGLEI